MIRVGVMMKTLAQRRRSEVLAVRFELENERGNVKTCEALMNEIKRFDCRPTVYRVAVTAWYHTEGYSASVDFRASDIRSLSARGNSPREALTTLLATLSDAFGKCQHCGEYHTGKGE